MIRRFLKKASKVLLCTLCACASADRIEQAANEGPVNREMWHWSTHITDRGKSRAQVSAGSFQQVSEDEPARFSDGVRVVFFNAQGDTVSTLRAERGEINASGDDMKVFESVVVVARDCTQLQTDSLRWQRDENRIMGEGHVTISRPDGTETGVGFNASSDLKQWTLLFVNTRMRRKKP
ncbi:MAG: LPS export ABC transporter periplasmic protein LptC [Gemmatimonadota bacterium]|nr:LPS export ABC transporter periplasmic protein LptC [Gemmatimonadota bacterium]MDE2832134.1 LPS export ABC transporter periplasmic protein LptC [Gemmatimonadota bacterium]MDE2954305.1 LPS export ABC transporter periplasmic protein LptC [Gemmatimonadota bacterium]